MMSLPWDLFKFSIDITNDNTLDKFLDVVKNANERIGYYFEDHFIHNKIWVWSLHIESSLFEKIFDNCDCLNQIWAIEDINWDKDLFKGNSTTLLKIISLKDKDDFIVDRKHFVFPEKLTELCLSKSLSEDLNFLKRIYFLHLSFSSIKESLSILEDVGKLGVQINFLYIRGSNHEEGESLTNPDYYHNILYLIY